MDHVSTITVQYGGFHMGSEKRTLRRDGDNILLERMGNMRKEPEGPFYEGMGWKDLMGKLSHINIGQWQEDYFDRNILDGIQWSVDIEFDDDTPPRHYFGSNKFPDGFDSFLKIMEMK